jgi:NAD(P)-dependent dehydrogenase (short-subunit alcohol dehydrogenase family)
MHDIGANFGTSSVGTHGNSPLWQGSLHSGAKVPLIKRQARGSSSKKEIAVTNIIVVIGAGSIGQAIARRVSAGKRVLLADLREENANAAARTLHDAGFEVNVAKVDVASRASIQALVETALSLGAVSGVIHAAGVSPTQASPETILKVDLYGTAVVLEEFGSVIASGGSGVIISSQSGHRLPALTAEQDKSLATTPADGLLALPMLQPDRVTDPLHAYQLSKRGNSLRVMAEAVRWGRRGARVNTISPGIIMTPLARDELSGSRGAGYQRMIELCAAGRAGTPDEVGNVAALLMGPDGGVITGSNFLMDGGVTAAYWFGDLAPR